jgi:hypothetical protein
VSLSAIPRDLRKLVFDRDGARCRYCKLAQFGQASIFHINHVVPRSKGGTTHESNLVLQCPHCSLHKSNQTEGTDADTGVLIPLFHPIRQRWEDDFSLIRDGTVRGLTASGRVTSIALRMNDPVPRVARALQIQLGLIELHGD